MKNIGKVVIQGLKGRKAETKVIVEILSFAYAFCLLFVVFQESFLEYRLQSEYLRIGPVEEFFMSGKFLFFLLLTSFVMVVYALNSPIKQRKYRTLMLRGMGATLGQLAVMSLYESIVIGGISLILGSLFGIIGSVLVLLGARLFIHWKMLFVMDWVYLILSFLFTAILFSVGMVVSTLYISSTRITSSFRADSGILWREKMPKLKKIRPLSLIHICKRNRMFYQSKTYIRALFSILVILIMTISLVVFTETYERYKLFMEEESYRYLFHPPILTDGISREVIEELEEMPEVLSVEKGKFLNAGILGESIQICWEGWKGNEYVTTQRRYEQADNAMQSYDKEGDYLIIYQMDGVPESNEERLAYYENIDMEGLFDREKFVQGEECILFLTPYQVRDIGGEMMDYDPVLILKDWEDDIDQTKPIYEYEKSDDSIKPGDIIEVETPWGAVSVTVGGIVREVQETIGYENMIAVSEKFLERFFTEDTSEIYNNVVIHTDKNADFEKTNKKITAFFRELRREEELTNEAEVLEQIRQQHVAGLFQKFMFIFFAGLLYILVMYQRSIGYFDGERRRIGIFQSLGMSKKKIKSMYLIEGMSDIIVISLISFLCSGVWFVFKLRKMTSFDSWNVFLKELASHIEYVNVTAEAFLTATVFFVCVYLITTYWPIRKILKNDVIENTRQI